MELLSTFSLVGAVLGVLFALSILVAFVFRRVVSTNEVHIVQSSKSTTSYGKGTTNGNTYYEWPSFLPIVGVTKVVLPVSNFDIALDAYEAYDAGRLPFMVDIMAFFRISNSNEAAQRVASFHELQHQLKSVVQGAVRSILASHPIEEIMQGRSQFATLFTNEVRDQLAHWGVEPVKNIELMDIRDSKGSEVIHNIMSKKKSQIAAESRIAIAENERNAQLSEIEAKRVQDLAAQDAKQAVGEREISVQLVLNQQEQQAQQTVADLQRVTTEKDMAVQQVSQVRSAEIAKEVQVVEALQDQQTRIIRAEAEKQTLTLQAEGQLEAKKREAEGISLEGEARANAEKAMQLAPVSAQIALAQEIGENQNYQTYLVTVRQIEANQAIGMAQAAALEAADVKVIATSDNASRGMSSVGDLITATGGTRVASMLEAIQQTPVGQRLVDSVLPKLKAPENGVVANGA